MTQNVIHNINTDALDYVTTHSHKLECGEHCWFVTCGGTDYVISYDQGPNSLFIYVDPDQSLGQGGTLDIFDGEVPAPHDVADALFAELVPKLVVAEDDHTDPYWMLVTAQPTLIYEI